MKNYGFYGCLFCCFFTVNILLGQAQKRPPLAHKSPKHTASPPQKAAPKPVKTPTPPLSNESIFWQKMAIPKQSTLTAAVVAFGKSFLGNSYPRKHTTRTANGQIVLQPIENEVLTINLKNFDCVTFPENLVALAQTQFSGAPDFDLFKDNLTQMRYRNSDVDYAARLHYFSDWLFENEKVGTLKNITKDLGGVPFNKRVFYMSQKKDTLYGNMADPTTYAMMLDVERAISERQKFFIPKNLISGIESRLREGDIVGITNVTEGLDMAHVGIVVWQNGRAHLLHASSDLHQVTISKDPLVDYLARHRLHSGIMVGRLSW